MALSFRCTTIVIVVPAIGLLLAAFGCGQTAEKAPEAKPREFVVEDMTCQNCVEAVTAAVEAVPGVQSVEVSLEQKRAVVVAPEVQVSNEVIESAIGKVGYRCKRSRDRR